MSFSYSSFQSDVNTVVFVDETGHLIYYGSDDNLCKVATLNYGKSSSLSCLIIIFSCLF
jgi:hypothetical protein